MCIAPFDYGHKEIYMDIYNEVLNMINSIKRVSIPISKKTNLYTDLRMDSLSYINFLLKVEQHFKIDFDITEMENCLQVENLVAIITNKVRESNINYD